MDYTFNDDVRIHWRQQGDIDKPALVLLNSIGTDQSLFDRVAPGLLEDFRLFRIDTRGHGRSDASAGDYSLDLLSDDVLAVMDAAQLRSALFCGLSLGGMMAMNIALKAPERVRGLLLACTSSVMPDKSFWVQRIEDVREKGCGFIADAAIGRLFSEEFSQREPGLVEPFRIGLKNMSAAGYAGCGAAIRDMNLLPLLGNIRAPTIVVSGTRDMATPHEEHGAKIAAAIPGAQTMVLQAGHLASVEDPNGFLAASRAFKARTTLS